MQLLRELFRVSFQVTVLTQPGGELTEVQCKSVARPEARQRLISIKDGLSKPQHGFLQMGEHDDGVLIDPEGVKAALRLVRLDGDAQLIAVGH